MVTGAGLRSSFFAAAVTASPVKANQGRESATWGCQEAVRVPMQDVPCPSPTHPSHTLQLPKSTPIKAGQGNSR